jgi:peptidoglycan hydrolase-like protein with peptidoglycan-binding domain
MRTAAAIVLGVGLAATAQANVMRHSAAPAGKIHKATTHMQRVSANTQKLTPQQIKTAQQQLKSEMLYKGPINGAMNHQTRVAIGDFQKQNGLPRTAKLDRTTLDRLTGEPGVGVGSSTPSNPKVNMAPAPVTPSPTTGAGGTNPPPSR